MPNIDPTLSELKFLAHDLRDAYRIHQAAWQAFGRERGPDRVFLHDFVRLPTGEVVITLRADRALLPPQAKPVNTCFAVGDRLNFQVRANAHIRNRSQMTGEQHRPCASTTELLTWLNKKGVQHGFSFQASEMDIDHYPEPVRKQGIASFFLNRNEYTGMITVVDPKKFAAALKNGIGPNRGLGFGMIQVRL